MLFLLVADQQATFYGHFVTWFISRLYCAALNFSTNCHWKIQFYNQSIKTLYNLMLHEPMENSVKREPWWCLFDRKLYVVLGHFKSSFSQDTDCCLKCWQFYLTKYLIVDKWIPKSEKKKEEQEGMKEGKKEGREEGKQANMQNTNS